MKSGWKSTKKKGKIKVKISSKIVTVLWLLVCVPLSAITYDTNLWPVISTLDVVWAILAIPGLVMMIEPGKKEKSTSAATDVLRQKKICQRNK